LLVVPTGVMNVIAVNPHKRRTTDMNKSITAPDSTQAAAAKPKAAKSAKVRAQKPHVAPTKAKSAKKATSTKRTPTGEKAAKTAPKASREKAAGPRPESKGAKVLEMIARSQGATLAEIMKATKWQKHTVRGFVSIASRSTASRSRPRRMKPATACTRARAGRPGTPAPNATALDCKSFR
jgi:hypothetical protein